MKKLVADVMNGLFCHAQLITKKIESDLLASRWFIKPFVYWWSERFLHLAFYRNGNKTFLGLGKNEYVAL